MSKSEYARPDPASVADAAAEAAAREAKNRGLPGNHGQFGQDIETDAGETLQPVDKPGAGEEGRTGPHQVQSGMRS
ncbi:hypothetical protein M0638_00355 [Roseomonas sp. NAR14]|uniref:Uncharacterized protein n=1 Tax=Roseomonas acroporae TaxID=2937791 RepID=A0A9X1Y2N8_9PROT|nr:hypothetical protein [Roseomonas acroporae]MCK8782829.1 hypothetical protein [Roseomonas acroporae]